MAALFSPPVVALFCYCFFAFQEELLQLFIFGGKGGELHHADFGIGQGQLETGMDLGIGLIAVVGQFGF